MLKILFTVHLYDDSVLTGPLSCAVFLIWILPSFPWALEEGQELTWQPYTHIPMARLRGNSGVDYFDRS